jgi:hypothetical protein
MEGSVRFRVTELFHCIDGHNAILRKNGVYRQTKLYKRGDYIYAGYSGGFVGLCRSGGTSSPDVSWDTVTITYDFRDGRMILK